ncbi:hypothetical protein V8C37DRAFT_396810 [Trichoderma ceciliae]
MKGSRIHLTVMPRLYHTKSKTGCARCRARRVKCDEAQPKCGCCARHKVDCCYDRAKKVESSRPGITDIPITALHQAGPAANPAGGRDHVHMDELMPSISTENRGRRYLELRLLHVWTIDICPTLPGSYEAQNLKIWSSDVPKLALDYDPLLSAIFSLSLLHMIFSESQVGLTKDELFAYRAQYFEATLRHHREAIGSMDHHTADSVGFTSIILILDAFASLRERRIQPHTLYKPPTEWLQMCRGVRSVFGFGLRIVGKDPDSALSMISKGAACFVDRDVVFSEANGARFAHLLSGDADEIRDNDDNEAYEAAVTYIGSIAAGKEAGEVPLIVARRLTIFPVVIPGHFITLLDMLRPRAMVILAHYFALAFTLNGLWWIGDSPAKEIEAIKANLGDEWSGMMEWPMQMLRDHGYPSAMSRGEA